MNIAKWILEVVVLVTVVALTTSSVVDEWINEDDLDFLRRFDNADDDLKYADSHSLSEYLKCEYEKRVPKSLNFRVKFCNYRNSVFWSLIYKWITAHGCYKYAQPSSFKQNETATIGTCVYDGNAAPCFLVSPESSIKLCYPVDPDIPEALSEVRRTMINKEAVEKWIRCSRAAMDCCDNHMNNDNVMSTGDKCPVTWDAWSCWDQANKGSTYNKVCPEFAYSNNGPQCEHFSSKECRDKNGTADWNQNTDYGTCSITPRLLKRNKIHVILLSISIAICFPAVVIMLAYKRLRTERLAMHRNLLICIILRNIFVIIIKSVVLQNELTSIENTIMSENGFWCRFLTTLEKLASSSTFTCMLLDGICLHRRIVTVFKKSLSAIFLISLASVITLIPVTTWIILMVLNNDSNCWLVYTESYIQWILDVPRILILCINTVLLIDILRIILTKLKSNDNVYQLSTAKTTLFLMPLFGVQFLLTAWRPNTTDCYWEQTYYVFTYVMDSTQGIMVAILYCYWNKEVHNLIKLTYKKTENVVSQHIAKNVNLKRPTAFSRRNTYSTMVDDYQTDGVSRQSRGSYQESPNKFIVKNDNEPNQTPKSVNKIFGNTFYSSSRDGLMNIDFENDPNDISNTSYTVEHFREESEVNENQNESNSDHNINNKRVVYKF